MWQALHGSVRRSKHGQWAALLVWLGAALSSAGCQDGYPIATTRCDRVCDLTRETACGEYEPAKCVATCEQQRWGGGAACDPAVEALLACLEIHRSEIRQLNGSCGDFTAAHVIACKHEQLALAECAGYYDPNQPSIGGFGPT